MTSFLFTPSGAGLEREVARRVARDPSQMQTDFSDVFSANWDTASYEDVSFGIARKEQEYSLNSLSQLSEVDSEFKHLDIAPMGVAVGMNLFKERSERIAELAEQYPERGILTWEQVQEKVKTEAQELRERAEIAAANAPPGQRLAGQFLGMGSAIMTQDPLVLATLPFGAKARGLTVAGRIMSAMGREAAMFGGIEGVAIQPHIYLQKRRIDSPYTVQDAVIAVLAVSGGSALFRGLGQSGKEGFDAIRGTMEGKMYREMLRDQADRIRARGGAGDRVDAELVDDYTDTLETTPRAPREIDQETGQDFYNQQRDSIQSEPLEEETHRLNMDQARDDLSDGRITEVEMETDPFEYLAKDIPLEKVSPRGIQVDAKRFQFKEGGDELGVTTRLKGVEQWNSFASGKIVVYEQVNGARFIVDGHQRLALAKRLDNDQIELDAYVLKEADGVGVPFARMLAAIKNIGEGTGTAIDTARIFKEMGSEAVSQLTHLPMESALVRNARALANLEPEAFAYVANTLDPDQYGRAAIVGELIQAGPEQLAAIRALLTAKPDNLLQARLIVEQIKAAGFQTTETMDLFGGQTISETLFKERAQVLNNAITRLKKDKATFRTLVEKEAEISGAGNVLERQSNLERLGEDEETIQTVSRLANTAGPISDALNEAARRIKDGERVDGVTGDFLAAARRRAVTSDRVGTEAGDVRRGEQEAAPADNRQEIDRATKEYVSDTRALLPDDPEIDELAADEARRVADILERNPDLEIPVEIRVDADGKEIPETRKASDVYDDLVEEDTRTTDMFTCMTGGGRA